MKALILLVFFFTSSAVFAQQSFYDVNAGDGNGIRFWRDDYYKIHMTFSERYGSEWNKRQRD